MLRAGLVLGVLAVVVSVFGWSLSRHSKVTREGWSTGYATGDSSANARPEPPSMKQAGPALPPPTLDDARVLLPDGWSIDDWLTSDDGRYLLLVTTRDPRTAAVTRERVTSLYHRFTLLDATTANAAGV